jgi:hypothetical protein
MVLQGVIKIERCCGIEKNVEKNKIMGISRQQSTLRLCPIKKGRRLWNTPTIRAA